MPPRLGQHFLTNPAPVRIALEALAVERGDTVIEIGPGNGALTFPLREAARRAGANLTLIERDNNLATELRARLCDSEVKVIEGDAVLKLPELLAHERNRVKIVGNIPFYITGKLLRILSEAPRPPERTVLMVQKEVAQRIVARPPKFNLLAAAVQFWAEPKIIAVIPSRDFKPPPKVESALLLLEGRANIPGDKERYERALRMAFRQPRKTLLNNLLSGTGKPRGEIERILHALKIPPQSRPQDLSVEDIMHIAGEL